MSSAPKTKRTCPQGHVYFKSSDCPTCPECEKNRVPEAQFLKLISAPARRALEREGILTEEILSLQTERQILALHGIGKTTIPVLKKVLAQKGLTFQHETNQPTNQPTNQSYENHNFINKHQRQQGKSLGILMDRRHLS